MYVRYEILSHVDHQTREIFSPKQKRFIGLSMIRYTPSMSSNRQRIHMMKSTIFQTFQLVRITTLTSTAFSSGSKKIFRFVRFGRYVVACVARARVRSLATIVLFLQCVFLLRIRSSRH